VNREVLLFIVKETRTSRSDIRDRQR